MDVQLQGEINALIRKLQGLAPAIKKVAQSDLAEASGILVSAVQGRAPVGDKPHNRYRTAKVIKGIRAPKGSGNIVATYQPGNLKRSFKTLKFRRSEAVFVGPKVGGNAADGYYAHMVEFGTIHQRAQNFVQAAVQAAGSQTLSFAAELLARRIEYYGRQNAV